MAGMQAGLLVSRGWREPPVRLPQRAVLDARIGQRESVPVSGLLELWPCFGERLDVHVQRGLLQGGEREQQARGLAVSGTPVLPDALGCLRVWLTVCVPTAVPARCLLLQRAGLLVPRSILVLGRCPDLPGLRLQSRLLQRVRADRARDVPGLPGRLVLHGRRGHRGLHRERQRAHPVREQLELHLQPRVPGRAERALPAVRLALLLQLGDAAPVSRGHAVGRPLVVHRQLHVRGGALREARCVRARFAFR